MNNTILKKKCVEDIIRILNDRIELLEKYRDIDINKEILDCLNLKTKYVVMLKEMVDDE